MRIPKPGRENGTELSCTPIRLNPPPPLTGSKITLLEGAYAPFLRCVATGSEAAEVGVFLLE